MNCFHIAQLSTRDLSYSAVEVCKPTDRVRLSCPVFRRVCL
jgi:hypothetical protein